MNLYILRHTGRIAAQAASLLSALMTLLGGWAGYIDPQTWAVPSILCLVFPILWGVSLAVCLMWLICTRDKIFGAVCAGLLLLTAPQMLNICPISFPDKLREGETNFRLLTYNVASFQNLDNKDTDFSRTMSYILQSDADLLCLQEDYGDYGKKSVNSKVSDSQIDSLHTQYPYRIKSDEAEVCIYSRYPIRRTGGKSRKSMQYFSYLMCKVSLPDKEVTVINVHLPSYRLSKAQKALASNLKHNPAQTLDKAHGGSLYHKLKRAFTVRGEAADELAEVIDTVSGPLIVCGDFNDVPNSYAWRTLMQTGLKDAYIESSIGMTNTFNANHLLFHIDQVLYRPGMGLRPVSTSRGDLRSSDHYPLTIDFAIK